MYRFVRKIEGDVEVECIHNREITRNITTNDLFFLMGDDFNRKFGIDTNIGEVAVYSPGFEKEFGCAWVGQQSDFEVMNY